ncbi:MAG: SAV_6107 family HEPN domain-containing protein [Actinomycetes bacterium]
MLLAPAELPTHSRDLLAGAARELVAAGAADESESRYAHAHLAALRAAAAVLAARARPRSKRGSRVRSAWVLLAEVAPEFAEWATFFAAGATKRAAAEAGFRGVVSPREADDLVREVESFLELVARRLGVAHQAMLIDQATGSPLSGRGFSAGSVRG